MRVVNVTELLAFFDFPSALGELAFVGRKMKLYDHREASRKTVVHYCSPNVMCSLWHEKKMAKSSRGVKKKSEIVRK
jgi:hypothetical protein